MIVKENMYIIVPPEVPEKEGFIFEGWYTEPEGGDKFNIESYDIEENGVTILSLCCRLTSPWEVRYLLNVTMQISWKWDPAENCIP